MQSQQSDTGYCTGASGFPKHQSDDARYAIQRSSYKAESENPTEPSRALTCHWCMNPMHAHRERIQTLPTLSAQQAVTMTGRIQGWYLSTGDWRVMDWTANHPNQNMPPDVVIGKAVEYRKRYSTLSSILASTRLAVRPFDDTILSILSHEFERQCWPGCPLLDLYSARRVLLL